MPTPVIYYTTANGPGQSSAQITPSRSLGGFTATTTYGGGVLGDLFGRASSVDVQDARPDFRCLYFYNPDGNAELDDVRVYVVPGTTGAAGFAVGVDPRPASVLDTLGTQAVEVANTYAAPPGVTFSTGSGYSTGPVLNSILPPRYGRAFWLKRVPAVTSNAAADYVDLVVEDAGGSMTIRRIYWEVEAYAEPTRYSDPNTYTPGSSPFRRTMVDFLTDGGARFTWALDPSMTDEGPYVFQLQASQSGVPNATDWVDIGPPAQDPLYLLDPDKRLWGMTSTLHYRAVLTTAVGTYTSPPANVFGRLAQEQWVQVRELMRKEQLMQRRFVGLEGFLLKARRYGPRCSCVDQTTGEIKNSSCPLCYGTGITGGYHPAVPLNFATMSNPAARERVGYNENLGTIKPIALKGRVIATLPVVARDVWVQVGSDERYYAHDVEDLVSRSSVPVVFGVTWRMAPRSDVVYAIPLTRPDNAQPDWKTPTTLVI